MTQGAAHVTALETLRARRRREAHFGPALMTERWWDMLLRLFVADNRGEPMTARQLYVEVGCAVAVGERWIRYLDGIQAVSRDGDGRLEDTVTIAPQMLTRIRTLLEQRRHTRPTT